MTDAAAAHALDRRVSALLRDVGREIVLPHFRALSAAQISEKAPGEIVTIADRLSEERLARGLAEILPAARIVGEEATAADPGLLDGLHRGLVWIVDPIDGTANYAAGKPPFAIMVALVADGITLAGWILDPLAGRLYHAALGLGAWRDGTSIRSQATGATPPIGALALRYLPDDLGRDFAGRIAGRLVDGPIPRSAGHQYLRLIGAETDIALFWRMLPWDHAAGALILAEAGGRIAYFDGADYAVASGRRGTIAAATPDLWHHAQRLLIGEATQNPATDV